MCGIAYSPAFRRRSTAVSQPRSVVYLGDDNLRVAAADESALFDDINDFAAKFGQLRLGCGVNKPYYDIITSQIFFAKSK